MKITDISPSGSRKIEIDPFPNAPYFHPIIIVRKTYTHLKQPATISWPKVTSAAPDVAKDIARAILKGAEIAQELDATDHVCPCDTCQAFFSSMSELNAIIKGAT